MLIAAVMQYGDEEYWDTIAGLYRNKTPQQCKAQWFMNLAPKNRSKKQPPWSEEQEREYV